MRSALRRKAPRGQQIIGSKPIPAPTAGWDAVSPIADMKPDHALVLDNWFPTPTDVRVRRGYQVFADGMGSSVVESLLPYHGVTSLNSKLFAAANDKIYDISTGGAPSASVTGLGNNRWQYVNFATPGGKFLWACNGFDAPQHFDGSSWAAPSLTSDDYDPSLIINVNAHKNRLWFVFADSTDAGYLDTNSVAGAIATFPLGPNFTKGGHLVAMATWTRDGGLGPDDYAVFISSEGECVVYEGTDPSDATLWSLKGVYSLGPPIGYRCFTKVAGDIALINIDGVLPLSSALMQDRGAAAAIAITKNINNAMNAAARNYKHNFGWELCPYPRGTYVLLNVPIQEGLTQHQYIMNTLTGSWCRFLNQNANCWVTYKDDLYFGGNNGIVYKADQTALDVADPIDAIGQTAYHYYDLPGKFKQWKAIQPILTTDSDSRPAIGISTDFKDNVALGTPTTTETLQARYDSAIYDTDTYAVESSTISDIASISGEGYCASIHFRSQTGRQGGITLWGEAEWDVDLWSSATAGDVDMELNGFNVFFEAGLAL